VWAATLDNLARELDIVVVVSAGNYDHQGANGASADDVRRGYPHYLLDPVARIIEPATGANVLTVGAIAREGLPFQSERNPDHVAPIPIAGPDQPAPFTRSGPGVRKAVKPELVDYGGNYTYDPLTNRVRHDPGLSMVSLNWRCPPGHLFALDCGTSFAAPCVAHLAAQVLAAYPDASANLIRGLLVHSAMLPAGTESMPLHPKHHRHLYGYGQPSFERALFSTDNRVVLIAESELPLDYFHVYAVPIPVEFREAKGKRRITVTLAFDPPVRHQRAEYLGSDMCFRLIRGESLNRVVDVYRQPGQGQKKAALEKSSHNCTLAPSSRLRDTGTLQHGVWHVSQGRMLAHDEPLYLVVRNDRGWQRGEEVRQRYAVVVSLEHDAPMIELYNVVRQRTRVSQRARLRG
jgi:hypothetical protein